MIWDLIDSALNYSIAVSAGYLAGVAVSQTGEESASGVLVAQIALFGLVSARMLSAELRRKPEDDMITGLDILATQLKRLQQVDYRVLTVAKHLSTNQDEVTEFFNDLKQALEAGSTFSAEVAQKYQALFREFDADTQTAIGLVAKKLLETVSPKVGTLLVEVIPAMASAGVDLMSNKQVVSSMIAILSSAEIRQALLTTLSHPHSANQHQSLIVFLDLLRETIQHAKVNAGSIRAERFHFFPKEGKASAKIASAMQTDTKDAELPVTSAVVMTAAGGVQQ